MTEGAWIWDPSPPGGERGVSAQVDVWEPFGNMGLALEGAASLGGVFSVNCTLDSGF